MDEPPFFGGVDLLGGDLSGFDDLGAGVCVLLMPEAYVALGGPFIAGSDGGHRSRLWQETIDHRVERDGVEGEREGGAIEA